MRRFLAKAYVFVLSLIIRAILSTIRWLLMDGNPLEVLGGCCCDPSRANTKPEEAGQPFLLLLLCQPTIFPCCTE